ncbi:MAG: hypothetical protein ACOYN4_20350, partial [Bacteroidales bacterium]
AGFICLAIIFRKAFLKQKKWFMWACRLPTRKKPVNFMLVRLEVRSMKTEVSLTSIPSHLKIIAKIPVFVRANLFLTCLPASDKIFHLAKIAKEPFSTRLKLPQLNCCLYSSIKKALLLTGLGI